MKLKSLLALPLIIVALAGCTQNKPAQSSSEEELTDEQIVELMISDPTNLIKSTGDIMYYGTTTRLKYGETLVAVKKYSYETGKNDEEGNPIIIQPEITWTFSDKHWTKQSYIDSNKVADPTRYKFVPESVYTTDTEYDTDLTLKMKYNDVTKEVVWHVHEGHIELQAMTIEEYRKGIASGSVSKSAYVKLYGYITGAHAPEHESSGVYMQDGEWAIQLYAGNLGTCYTGNGIEVGDLVYAVGNLSQYHGLDELYVATLQKVTDSEKAALDRVPDEPVVMNIEAGKFTATDLAHKDACLAKMDNLTFITVGKTDPGEGKRTNEYKTSESYTYLLFKDTEDKSVLLYITYHLDGRDAMKTLFASWTCGSTVVDFNGHLSWYDTPVLCPVGGAACFTTH